MGARVVRLHANGLAPSDELTHKYKFVLKLYVAGNNPRNESAIEILSTNLDKVLGNNYELSVHDVLEEPQLAEDEKILATPTLVKAFPLPSRRIIGDFSAFEHIRAYLNLPDSE